MASRLLLNVVPGLLLMSIVTALPTPDPCTIMPMSTRQHHSITVEVNPKCTNGSIWWQYPQNEMKVNFHVMDRSHTFKACVQEIHEPEVHNIFDMTGGTRQILKMPGAGAEVCSGPSVHGTATLMFLGPHEVSSYMAFIDYRLVMV